MCRDERSRRTSCFSMSSCSPPRPPRTNASKNVSLIMKIRGGDPLVLFRIFYRSRPALALAGGSGSGARPDPPLITLSSPPSHRRSGGVVVLDKHIIKFIFLLPLHPPPGGTCSCGSYDARGATVRGLWARERPLFVSGRGVTFFLSHPDRYAPRSKSRSSRVPAAACMLACLVPSPGPSANTLAARPTAAHDFFRRRSASKRTLRRLTG